MPARLLKKIIRRDCDQHVLSGSTREDSAIDYSLLRRLSCNNNKAEVSMGGSRGYEEPLSESRRQEDETPQVYTSSTAMDSLRFLQYTRHSDTKRRRGPYG